MAIVGELSDLWLIDEAKASRFTFDGAGNPVWSPDGREIAFCPSGQGSRYLTVFLRKPADNFRSPEPIVDSLPDGSRFPILRIPLKAIRDSGGKPIMIPEGNDRASERSDAGTSMLPKLIGIIKRNLSGAKRRKKPRTEEGVLGL